MTATLRWRNDTSTLALRATHREKTISCSGDTEWTESLIDAARGADLFVCEAYFYEKKIRFHLDYETLRARLSDRRDSTY